jgi:hypothetical protein
MLPTVLLFVGRDVTYFFSPRLSFSFTYGIMNRSGVIFASRQLFPSVSTSQSVRKGYRVLETLD